MYSFLECLRHICFARSALKFYMSDEIKVVAEMDVAATKPDILAISGHLLHIGHPLHLIGGNDFKQGFQRNSGVFALGRLGGYARKFIPVETVKGFTDKDYDDLESGVKKDEVVCERCWKNECPRYVGYANDPIERIVKELKDKGYVLEFIPVEMAKELKDEDYGLLCIPSESVKGSKDDGCALKFIPAVMVKELKEDGYALKFMPVEAFKTLKDEDYIKMESVGVIEAVVDTCLWKSKCIGYVNGYIEKMAKPEMGLLFSGAVMQNIYQLVTSGTVTTGKGKILMKLNEAAFMFLLYGLVMPRRAAGHIALAIGIVLASAAYLFTMSFAF